jgi:hypothetical protein
MRPPWLSLAVVLIATAAGPARGAARVEFAKGDDRVDVRVGGVVVTSYLTSPRMPKPILYPLTTPSGVVLSRGFPFKDVPGESKDHPHHAGIFFACDKVNGYGFWLSNATSPQIRHVRVVESRGGDGRGRLVSVSEWVGKDGKILLDEARTTDVIAGDAGYALDLTIDLTAREKVTFGETEEAGLGVRVADWMREDFKAAPGVVSISGTGRGRYASARGARGAKEIWGTRDRWVSLQADNDGKAAGLAILDHPKSHNHPTHWHARGYGLFAANPIGQGVFESARKTGQAPAKPLVLEPGQKVHFRYRVLVFDGRKTAEQLEQEYQRFAREE